jgi:hypothetical protein
MEGERGLARWLEDEAEGDRAWACGYRMEGVWYGGATWSEEGRRAGGRQEANAVEVVADRAPATRSRGAERGGGGSRRVGRGRRQWADLGRKRSGRAQRNSAVSQLTKFSN